MGGAVSSGEDNADLVDKLVEGGYVKDPLVEKVFRAVDRGDYFHPDQRMHAYKDQAWKNGNVHLSAPCIYAEVMEWLKLGPGMSFLNLGSGTGYLNTMAGLVIGPYGVNHGIEYHQDVIDYAEKQLEHFINTSEAFDEFEFCEPVFVRGNCLLLSPTCRLYDRIYCGAACPTEHENYMKNLIKLGGILVMPLNDQLIQVTRTSETQWETKSILPVSFARLIPVNPIQADAEFKIDEGGGAAVSFRMGQESNRHPTDLIELPPPKVMTMKEICRLIIRRILLKNIRDEHPGVCRKRPRKSKKKRQPPAKQRRFNLVAPETRLMLFGQFSDDSDWENSHDNEDTDQAERQNARDPLNSHDLTWGSQLRNTLFSRIFGPRLMFLPRELGEQVNVNGEGNMQMEESADVEEEEEEEENNDPQNNSKVSAGNARQSDSPMLRDEAMPDAISGVLEENDTSESSEDETSRTIMVTGVCHKEPALVTENNVIPAQKELNLNDSTSLETTTAHQMTSTNASIRFDSISVPTSNLATASRSFDTSTSSVTDQSTSYSSGVDTCSSIDADTETLSSIYWTKEFQMEEPDVAMKDTSLGELMSEGCKEPGLSPPRISPISEYRSRKRHDMEEDASLTYEEEFSKETEGNMDEKTEDDEPLEDSMEGPEANITYKTYLQGKVELLPVPDLLKSFLLFYRN